MMSDRYLRLTYYHYDGITSQSMTKYSEDFAKIARESQEWIKGMDTPVRLVVEELVVVGSTDAYSHPYQEWASREASDV